MMRQYEEKANSDRNRESSGILSGKTLFQEFDSHTAARLVEFGIEAWFSPGTLIFEENDQSGQFYFITMGDVALEQSGSAGPIRIQTLHQGEFLGWSALLGSGTRHFQARALTRVAALTFDGSLLRRTCDADPRFGYALMKRLLLIVTERLDATRMQAAGFQIGRKRRSFAPGDTGG
jgi:CRP/FNR family cyclic AMP-dependent transcriptional regulator